jgi:ribosomal protein S18 acetylase RimI-like enzyme
MIIRRGRYRCSMNFVSCIIILISTAIVAIKLRSSRHYWNIEAWTTASPKRAWNTQRKRDSQRLRCLANPVLVRSMKQSQETNMKHNCKRIDSTIPTLRTNATNFEVRDCTHGELNLVADIIMDSFYNYTDPSNIWKQLTKLAELNRIQQNFPYGSDKAHHRMLVVTSTNFNSSDTATSICGFVDIDTRIPNRPTSYKYNPRPYLSDLCIHPNYRRYGLASLLIQSCEDYCRSHHHSNTGSMLSTRQQNEISPSDVHRGPELYIRVETTNIIAIQMYQKLGYSILSDHADSSNPNILILFKAL